MVVRMTEKEDLQAPQSLPYAPLCIKDPREYFDSPQANALRSLGGSNDGRRACNCSLSTDDAFHHLMDQISSIKVNKLNCPVFQSDVALKGPGASTFQGVEAKLGAAVAEELQPEIVTLEVPPSSTVGMINDSIFLWRLRKSSELVIESEELGCTNAENCISEVH
ncbi:hypothetical protein ACP70R_012141 [Stipagrostis hirtigluma subsp. patula]